MRISKYESGVLSMDTPRLELAIRDLESHSDSLDRWLTLWIVLVVAGLIVEVWMIVKKHFESGRPDHQSTRRLALALIGPVLITIGVAGELGIHFKAGSVNTDLRNVNAQMVAALNKEAAEARQRAGDADERSVRLELSAAQLRNQNLGLDADLSRFRKESEPRRLTGAQKATLTKLLDGHPTKLPIVSRLMDSESSDFADDLASALHAAQWESVRIVNRLSSKYGVSVGVVKGTPTGLPEIKLLSSALKAIGVANQVVTFAEDDASTSPHFQSHVLYLVVEQHPPLPSTGQKLVQGP
jgi:hypothetical protein